jgi:hypothetical protein
MWTSRKNVIRGGIRKNKLRKKRTDGSRNMGGYVQQENFYASPIPRFLPCMWSQP